MAYDPWGFESPSNEERKAAFIRDGGPGTARAPQWMTGRLQEIEETSRQFHEITANWDEEN